MFRFPLFGWGQPVRLPSPAAQRGYKGVRKGRRLAKERKRAKIAAASRKRNR